MAEGDNTAPPSNKSTLEEIKERLALLDTEIALNKELLTTTERRSEEEKNELTRIQANIQAEKDRLALAAKKGELSEKTTQDSSSNASRLPERAISSRKKLR